MPQNASLTETATADTTSVADVTDLIEREDLDPERVSFYVTVNGKVYALLLDGIDDDGDVAFRLGKIV